MMEIGALKALLASLLGWIALHGGFVLPAEQPEIAFVPQAELQRMACTGPCPIFGLYTGDRVIHLDEKLMLETNICAQSILVHELVHYVQDANGRFADEAPAPRWQLREIEAHELQNLYLLQHGRRILAGRYITQGAAYVGKSC